MNLFHSHYIQLEQTGWRVAENSRSSSDSRRSRTQQGHPGHSSQSRDGLRVLARSTNSKPQHLQNSVEDTMTKGASFVAKCIYEARRRTEELDLLMSSTSTSLHPPSQSTNGVVHEKCQLRGVRQRAIILHFGCGIARGLSSRFWECAGRCRLPGACGCCAWQ